MSEPLVFEQRIELRYRHDVGAMQRAFLEGLAAERLVAATDGTRRYVPARPFAPDGTRLEELVDAGPHATVIAASTAHHLPGAPVYGLVLAEGSQTPMLHLLEEELPAGTVVAPVWEPGGEPGIRALRAFRRA